MEKIVEPIVPYLQIAAIAGATALLCGIAIIIILLVMAKRGHDHLDDPDNWEWW